MAHIILKGTGQKMPVIGLGLWKIPKTQTADAVYRALKLGYRLLDSAADYGNEIEAGEGLARAIKDGVVTREEVFVTTKLWNTYHSKEHVLTFVKKQLSDWKLEYFDLLHMHFPCAIEYVDPAVRYPPTWHGADKVVTMAKVPVSETWKALEEVHDLGLAKNLGVSNFQAQLLTDLNNYARIPPAALQVEIHPYLPQLGLINLAKHLGMAVTAYCSFGNAGWIELGDHLDVPLLFTKEPIIKAATHHQKTPAQVLLNWAIQLGLAVIPKSSNEERLKENLDADSFKLTDEEVKEISGLNQHLRFNDPRNMHIGLTIFA